MGKQRASLQTWEVTRDANRRIAESAHRLQFVSRMPLFCECDDPDCNALVLITRDEFDSIDDDSHVRLTAPGHTVDSASHGDKAPGYWLQRTS